MALQPILGYPSSWRAPFAAAQIKLGQGPSTAAAAERTAIYYGPKTSAGSWTVNTVYEVKNEADAITGAGVGSPLHRALRMHLRVNPRGRLYAVCYAATSGGSPATATSTITWTTTPGAKGQTRVWVCGELCTYNFTTSDTVTTIAAGIKAAINAKPWLPVTANNSSGILTLTAKIAGASQGDGTIAVIRVRAEIDAGVTTTVATSGSLGSGTAGADGSTTEATNLTNALAATAASRYYYKGFTVWATADLAVAQTHITNMSDPSPGLRCRGFSGYTSTLANVSTLAIARNYERFHICWQKDSEHDTAELAAWLLAVHQREEEASPTFPGFDGYTNQLILPCATEASWPTDNDKNDAVTDGVCVIESNQTRAALTMSVTTRSKDSAGTNDDFRSCETHRISGMDHYVDTVLLRWNQQFKSKGRFLREHPKGTDGAPNMNAVLPSRTTTEVYVGNWLKRINNEMEDTEVFLDASEVNAAQRINVDPQNSSRIEVGVSARTVNVLHQATFLVQDVTPG